MNQDSVCLAPDSDHTAITNYSFLSPQIPCTFEFFLTRSSVSGDICHQLSRSPKTNFFLQC